MGLPRPPGGPITTPYVRQQPLQTDPMQPIAVTSHQPLPADHLTPLGRRSPLLDPDGPSLTAGATITMTTTTGPHRSRLSRTDAHPSHAGIRSPSTPPIGRYRRVPVQVHQTDPDAPEVARRLIALIATRWPATPAEHIGSTAVPDLAGKGIIDLLLAPEPAHIPAITQALLELGFQPQVPAAFPPTRPMLSGAYRYRATTYRAHVHMVPASSPEVAAMRGLRDALCADPVLRRRYAALKRAIVAGGPADPVAFTRAKHDWIAATLAYLGLADEQPRRLYQDDLNPDSPDQLAS
jgi:GrpB-like predicted nucleotidyltransferase (UPF0157 family)